MLSTLRSANAALKSSGFQRKFSSSLAARFGVTAEVTVSKLFPAGYGWQTASCIAEDMGMSATGTDFALMTGVGDFVGVFFGHTLYFATKKVVYDSSIDLNETAQTGFLLASAAFCSGTAWQPTVNALTDAGLEFVGVATGTGLITGTIFFLGLRAGRIIWPKLGMGHIAEGNSSNLTDDAALSLSIGGATGCFVGTDIGQVGNFIRPLFGVEDGMSTVAGAIKAGSSTGFGFAAVQSLQNFVTPADRCWVD